MDLDDDPVRTDFRAFVNRTQAVFGDHNASCDATRQLEQLSQRKSCSKYAASFRHLASKVTWNDVALIHRFYSGLNDPVKDTLATCDEMTLPSSLIEYMDLCIHRPQLFHFFCR